MLGQPEHARWKPPPSTAPDVLEVERWIAARPETVFSYFTDPERFRRWQGEHAAIDPHPGGAFRMNLGGASGPAVRGQLLQVVAPRRLVFTWGWGGVSPIDEGMATLMSGPSIVEISLEPKGEGTLLRLRQSGPP